MFSFLTKVVGSYLAIVGITTYSMWLFQYYLEDHVPQYFSKDYITVGTFSCMLVSLVWLMVVVLSLVWA